jgi:flagellar biosynthesis/type III secretory pathway chaperone
MDQSQSIDLLITILEGQRECYAALLRLAEVKRRALVQDDLPALDRALEEEQSYISGLGRLERERMEVTARVAQQAGLSTDQVTVEDLLPHVAPTHRSALGQLRSDIVAQIQRLKEINQVNGQLIEQALRVVNACLSAFGGQSQSATYGPQTKAGGKGERANARFLDRKI